jgi:hypothetical protein
MISLVASLAFTTAVTVAASTTPGPVRYEDGRMRRAAASSFSGQDTGTSTARQSSSNDPLRTGAIVGAIAGGVTGAFLASVGCGVGEVMGGPESSCTGPALAGAAIGAGLGALIGVGIDAMFDQAPGTGVSAAGRRKGVRLRFGF